MPGFGKMGARGGFGSLGALGSAQVNLPAFAFQAESTALFTAFTASGQSVNANRKYTCDYWIRKMKVQGVYAKLSRLWIIGDTSGQSLINWINPGTGDLTIVGAPTFTAPAAAFSGRSNDANVGFKAASTADYLETGIGLQSVPASSFTLGVYCGSGAAAAFSTSEAGALSSTTGIVLNCYNTGGYMLSRCQSVLSGQIGLAAQWDGVGMHTVVRSNSSNFDAYHNSVKVATVTQAFASPGTNPTLSFLTAKGNTGFSARAWHAGFYAAVPLTAADLDMLYRAIRSIKESIQYGDVLLNEQGYAPSVVNVDAVVYGWTEQAIIAAYEAARQGKTVALVGGWRDVTVNQLGGMTANGLGSLDLDNHASIGGLARLFLTRCNAADNIADTNFTVQPRTANWIFRQMLDQFRTGGLSNLTVYSTGGVVSVSKSGATITSIRTTDRRTFAGRIIEDHSYEGDVIGLAGLSTIIGREAKSASGNDSGNGFRGYAPSAFTGNKHQFGKTPNIPGTLVTVDPWITPGVQGSGPIAGVDATTPASAVGDADSRVMAYNFRLDLKGATATQVPFDTATPSGYSAATYEAVGRWADGLVAIGQTLAITDIFVNNNTGINSTYDFNNCGGMSTNWIGGSMQYVAATTYAQRETVWKGHENYIRGLLYYLLTEADARVSGQPVRASLAAFGWSVDHHLDPHPNDLPYWPGQMYVRAFRRLIGDYIHTGNDYTMTDGTTPRSTKTVGTVSYSSDSHHNQRFAYNDLGTWKAINEGNYVGNESVDQIAPIPLEACVPKVTECTNLCTAWSFSSLHTAFGAMRINLTSMQIAQSMGMLAAQAIDEGVAVQNVTYATLRTRLLASASLAGEVAPVLPQIN